MSADVPVTSCGEYHILRSTFSGELASCLPENDEDETGQHDDTTNVITPSGITEKANEFRAVMKLRLSISKQSMREGKRERGQKGKKLRSTFCPVSFLPFCLSSFVQFSETNETKYYLSDAKPPRSFSACNGSLSVNVVPLVSVLSKVSLAPMVSAAMDEM